MGHVEAGPSGSHSGTRVEARREGTPRILEYARPHARLLGLTVVLAVGGVAADLARPWPIKIVVDYGLAGRRRPHVLSVIGHWLPGGETHGGLILWSVVAAILIVVASSALTYAVLVLATDISRRIVQAIMNDVFAKLQRLSLRYHGRSSVGDLLQRVAVDSFVLFSAIATVALPMITALLTLVGMFAIMSRLDLTLTLVALGAVPVLGISLAFFARPLEAASTQLTQRQGEIMSVVEQSLLGIRAIQAFAREAEAQRRVDRSAGLLGRAYFTWTRVGGGLNVVNSALAGVLAAVLLGVGALRVREGHLTIGGLIVFLTYLGSLYAPLVALATAVGTGLSLRARARRVTEVLGEDEEVAERPDAVRMGRSGGDVVFDGVTFAYEPGAEPVLKDVSFEARRGEITAFVGVTGAGKTTLVSLLGRFYDPSLGRILLDGRDLRDFSLRSLRENVSYVLQEPFLFPVSVAENIAFACPFAPYEEIVAAAKAACAHEFIERLPEGYATVLGERGVALSGGERQRIGIARAILMDAPVLILDEPTSSVDADTENEIFGALMASMHEKTTFLISHRLSTILRADQILVLEDGAVVERGAHEELIEGGELYARLYLRQFLTLPRPEEVRRARRAVGDLWGERWADRP